MTNLQSFKSLQSNGFGKNFEKLIDLACKYYRDEAEVLEIKSRLGGLAGVCIGIKDRYFFIPWNIWANMKDIFGRKYVKADDLSRYEVIFRQGVRFLDYKYE